MIGGDGAGSGDFGADFRSRIQRHHVRLSFHPFPCSRSSTLLRLGSLDPYEDLYTVNSRTPPPGASSSVSFRHGGQFLNLARQEKLASQGADLEGSYTKLVRCRGFFPISEFVAPLGDWV